MKSLAHVLAIAVLFCGTSRADEPAVQGTWLAVTTPGLREALAPLAQHRRAQGLNVVVSTDPPEQALRRLGQAPAFLLLVGDDLDDQREAAWRIPSKQRPLYRWRDVQARTFASDALWGDVDGDLLPDFPVGRLPVRTPEQLSLLVAKIVAYESQPPSAEDLRLPVWTGAAGYGGAIDRMATSLAVNVVRSGAPPWVEPWLLSGDANHSLSGWPPDQPARFSRQLQAGGVLAVMMGHASRDSFWAMEFSGQDIVYTANMAAAALGKGLPAPPTVIFACSAGHFTGIDDCLAESLLGLPGGPVGVVAATTESHPLPNYYSGQALLRALVDPKVGTFGSLWLTSQRAARAARQPLMDRMLKDVEGSLEPEIDIEKLKRDQPLMYALLGDPATRIRRPADLQCQVTSTEAGWRWRAQKPQNATRLLVQLRKAGHAMPVRQGTPAPEQAGVQLDAANASFGYERVSELAADDEWTGDIQTPGMLRLIAIADDRLWVACEPLAAPPSE